MDWYIRKNSIYKDDKWKHWLEFLDLDVPYLTHKQRHLHQEFPFVDMFVKLESGVFCGRSLMTVPKEFYPFLESLLSPTFPYWKGWKTDLIWSLYEEIRATKWRIMEQEGHLCVFLRVLYGYMYYFQMRWRKWVGFQKYLWGWHILLPEHCTYEWLGNSFCGRGRAYPFAVQFIYGQHVESPRWIPHSLLGSEWIERCYGCCHQQVELG